jgi:hypothetical protein
LEEHWEILFIRYLNHHFPPIRLKSVEDLNMLSARSILEIADRLNDELLPYLVALTKKANKESDLFQKLMGNHEEVNRKLVDSFFERYMAIALEKTRMEDNLLLRYLPPDSFQDLAFLQSRERFFKAQRIEHINEFLDSHFHLKKEFGPGEQDEAWNYFWGALL